MEFENCKFTYYFIEIFEVFPFDQINRKFEIIVWVIASPLCLHLLLFSNFLISYFKNAMHSNKFETSLISVWYNSRLFKFLPFPPYCILWEISNDKISMLILKILSKYISFYFIFNYNIVFTDLLSTKLKLNIKLNQYRQSSHYYQIKYLKRIL